MQKVICKNPKGFKLTKDKEYVCLEENSKYFTIVNDGNNRVKYNKNIFLSIIKEKPIKEKEQPVLSEEEKEELLFKEFKNSLEISHTSSGRNINFIVNSRQKKVSKTLRFTIELQTSYVSCGILEINGLNTLLYNVNIERKYANYLLKRLLLYIYKLDTYAFVLTSTTAEAERVELFNKVLDEMDKEVHRSYALNPNSGNDIIVWLIKL